MKRIVFVVVFSIIASCHITLREQAKHQFSTRDFDTAVLDRLQLYDSLRAHIHSSLSTFFSSETLEKEAKNWNGSSASFFINQHGELSPLHSRNVVSESMPTTFQKEILAIFSRIGNKNIYGFAIQPDSTLIVLLRNEYVKEFHLDIRERLTWSNNEINPPVDEFFKTKTVTEKWSYLIWYDKRGGW